MWFATSNTGREPAIDLFCLDLLMCVQDDSLMIDPVTADGLTPGVQGRS